MQARVILACLMVALAAGCESHFAGHTNDWADVVTGVADFNIWTGRGTARFRLEKAKLECSGTLRSSGSDTAKGELRCDDGRRVDAEISLTSMTGGNGRAWDEYGNGGQFVFDLDAGAVKAPLESYRREVARRNLSVDHILAKRAPAAALQAAQAAAPVAAPALATQPAPAAVQSAAIPAQPSVTVPPAARPAIESGSASSKTWAVVIGVSEYADTRVPSLRYAAADAKAFHDWLISPSGGRYPPAQTQLLIDRDATSSRIREALFSWLRQAIAEDVVVIYFAGHGSPDSPDTPQNLYLLPHDIRYDAIASTGFPMWDIETALKRFIKARRVVVIADACHSGGVGAAYDLARRSDRNLQVNPISNGFQGLATAGESVAVLSASDDRQSSVEGVQFGGGHGAFTHFLLEGLSGRADYNNDSRVTLGELIPFISEQVRRATQNSQSPTVAGRFDPALTIAR